MIPHTDLSRYPVRTRPVNGIDYAYLDEGSGPVLLLLHGFPDLAGGWDDVIEALAQDYRCIAPFMRGYYPTGPAPDGDYNSSTVAEDIQQLAKDLGVDQYVAVGHDWGASVAYSLGDLHPEAVTKLITLAIPHPHYIKLTPAGLWRARHFIRLRKPSSSLDYTRRDNFAYIDRLYRRWAPNWDGYQPSSDLFRRTLAEPGYLESVLGWYWCLADSRKDKEDPEVDYQQPPMPILCFAGAADGAISEKAFHAMKADLGDQVSLRIVPKAGHWPHREAPELFLREVRAFLAD